jgi:hypothetical protein
LQALDHMKTAKLPRCYYDFMDQLKTNPAGAASSRSSRARHLCRKQSIEGNITKQAAAAVALRLHAPA